MQITDCGYVVGSPFYFSFSLQFCDVRLYSFVHWMMVVVGLVGFAIPAEDDCDDDDALKEENDGGGDGSRG